MSIEIRIKDCIKRTKWGDALTRLYRLIRLKIDPENSKNIKYDLETEKVFERILNKHSVCVDVGCHKGEILRKMIKYAPQSMHYGFEPIPDLLKQLKIEFNKKAYIYGIALSDTKSTKAFNYVLSNPAYSGFKKRRYDNLHEIDTTINVETDLLDNIIPFRTKIDLIKIDVEGAELFVLRGAKRTILHNKPIIIFETGLGGTDIYGFTPDDIYSYLCEECGLKISTMEEWLKGNESFDVSTFRKHFYDGLDFYYIAYSLDK